MTYPEFMMRKYSKGVSVLLLLTSTLLLSACGGDSSGSNGDGGDGAPPANEITLTAEDVLDPIQSGSSSIVTLKNKVHSSQPSSDNFITNVTAVTQLPECQDIIADNSGYTAQFGEFVGVCVYQYDAGTAADTSVQASAYSIVAVQSEIDSEVELFGPISAATLVDQPVTIDLKNELLGQVPEGYTLSGEVTLLGNGSVSVNVQQEKITFSPDGAEGGYAKLIYSYSNGDNIKMGNISVSVSSTVNGAPDAPDIDYSADPDNPVININEQAVIDLAPYVSDPDGDALQLVDVDSWNAAVSPAAPEDMNNLKLNFTSTQVGEQFIYYVLSDHFGGYASGVIRVEVYDPEESADWGNLKQGMNLYYGPLTKSDADGGGIEYTSTNFDSNGANVATFNVNKAQASCEAVGRLPTSDELVALFGITAGGPAAYDGWPVSVGYYAQDGDSFHVVDLSTGQDADVNAGGQYVTCVGQGGFVIDTAQSDTEAVANGEDQALVAAQVTLNGTPVSGQVVSASVNGSASLAQDLLTTDEDGYARFYIENVKAETVIVSTLLGSNERSQSVSFIGDKATAQLSSEVTVNNQVISGGVNKVIATLTDAFDNPVAGEPVTFSVDNVDAQVSSPHWDTDGDGELVAEVVWTGGDVTQSQDVLVTSLYTRPDMLELTASELVNFTAAYVRLLRENDGAATDTFNSLKVTTVGMDNVNIPGVKIELKLDNPMITFNATGDEQTTETATTDEEGSHDSVMAYIGPSLPAEVEFYNYTVKARVAGSQSWESEDMFFRNKDYSSGGDLNGEIVVNNGMWFAQFKLNSGVTKWQDVSRCIGSGRGMFDGEKDNIPTVTDISEAAWKDFTGVGIVRVYGWDEEMYQTADLQQSNLTKWKYTLDLQNSTIIGNPKEWMVCQVKAP